MHSSPSRAGATSRFDSNSIEVPFIPGFTKGVRHDTHDPANKGNHAKTTTLTVGAGGMALVGQPRRPASSTGFLETTQSKLNASSRPGTVGLNTSATTGRKISSGTTQPKFLTFNRQVLRFNAYFKEAVHESATENYRVHRCTIQYHLEDDTIEVSTVKRHNSGLPQGAFLKRHKVPKPGGSGGHFEAKDIAIGITVDFYCRKFRVVDCDDFTRGFYSSINMPQAGPEEYPPDPYETLRASYVRQKPPNPDSREVVEKGTQFFANDKKVLRFYAVWDDRRSMYGDKHRYVVHYFLADNTVEINEVHDRNSGYDPYPSFLKRGPMRKEFAAASIGDKVRKHEMYQPADLRIGVSIQVLGRTLLIYDCDDATKRYYAKEFGMDVERDFQPIDVSEPVVPPPVMEIPPHNGLGDEEDTAQNCFKLIGKPVKRNIRKLMENDRKILRFTAKLRTEHPIDKGREFIISYFLADDTMSVFERPLRNSGVVGGQFLKRQKMKNAATEKYFDIKELYIGADVTINTYDFHLNGADEYSLSYMEGKPAQFSVADCERIEMALRNKFRDQSRDIARTFRMIDLDKNGVVTKDEFRAACIKFGWQLTDHELLTIMRRYDQDRTGAIDYEEFCGAVLAKDFRADSRLTEEDSNLDGDDDEAYAQAAAQVVQDAKDTRKIGKLLQDLRKIILSRGVYLKDVFREFDTDKSGSLGQEEFVRALESFEYHLSPNDLKLVLDQFFYANDTDGNASVDYDEFSNAVLGTEADAFGGAERGAMLKSETVAKRTPTPEHLKAGTHVGIFGEKAE